MVPSRLTPCPRWSLAVGLLLAACNSPPVVYNIDSVARDPDCAAGAAGASGEAGVSGTSGQGGEGGAAGDGGAAGLSGASGQGGAAGAACEYDSVE